MELIRSIAKETRAIQFFCRCGRAHPGRNKLYREMVESGVIKDTVMVYGQMNEPPGVRLRVGALRAFDGGNFRDQGRDVLLFIDNIFRFRCLARRSRRCLGRDAFRSWYQPSPGDRDGRAARAHYIPLGPGSITSMQAVYVPADDYFRPCASCHIHPSGCHYCIGAARRGQRDLSGSRPAGIHLAASWASWARNDECSRFIYLAQHHRPILVMSQVCCNRARG